MLRIVNLAVAPVDLIVIVKMLVDAHIEGVLTAGVYLGGLVVVLYPTQVCCGIELRSLMGSGSRRPAGS